MPNCLFRLLGGPVGLSRAVLASVSMLPVLAIAQPARDDRPPLERVTLDATMGVNSAASNARRYDTDGGLSVTVTVAAHPSDRRAFAWAVTTGARGQLSENCIIDPPFGENSKCRPQIPSMWYVGVLGGFARATHGVAARVLVGPTVFSSSERARIGAQAHADLAIGPQHIAVVIGLRGSLVPQPRGETLRLLSREFGLRIR